MRKEQLESFETLCDALSPEQRELLVLYGANLFKKGLCRGGVDVLAGAGVAVMAYGVCKVIKYKKTLFK